jgi:hypothetical protein
VTLFHRFVRVRSKLAVYLIQLTFFKAPKAMVRFDMKKGAYVRMKLVEKMIDHMDIPSSIIPKVHGQTELRLNSHRSKI